MKDITEELEQFTSAEQIAIDNFVNGADQGVIPLKKVVNKHNHTSLLFNTKQREFFDTVKNQVVERIGKISVPKFLLLLWHYHTSKKKCVYKDYLDYSIFISGTSGKGDKQPVTTTWNASLVPLKQQIPLAELTLGNIGSKGIVLVLALHYAKNELDMDLTDYLN